MDTAPQVKTERPVPEAIFFFIAGCFKAIFKVLAFCFVGTLKAVLFLFVAYAGEAQFKAEDDDDDGEDERTYTIGFHEPLDPYDAELNPWTDEIPY